MTKVYPVTKDRLPETAKRLAKGEYLFWNEYEELCKHFGIVFSEESLNVGRHCILRISRKSFTIREDALSKIKDATLSMLDFLDQQPLQA